MKFHANVKRTLKKFQLLGSRKFCTFNFSPKISYFAKLLICYTQYACQASLEKYAFLLSEDTRQAKRRNEMLDELKPFIEQFGFEVEDDEEDIDVYEDESLSPANDCIITMPSWDEVPF